jgi:Flp pilus assembly protein TadG
MTELFMDKPLVTAGVITSNPLATSAQGPAAAPQQSVSSQTSSSQQSDSAVVFEDLEEIDPSISNLTSQTDAAGNITESGTVSVSTNVGAAVETITETATVAGETTFSVDLVSGQETATQEVNLTSAGLTSDQIVLDGVAISAPLSNPADLNVAPDGSLLVETSSPSAGGEFTIDALTNGTDKIFSGGD